MTTKKKESAEFKLWIEMLKDSITEFNEYPGVSKARDVMINKVMKKWKLVRK